MSQEIEVSTKNVDFCRFCHSCSFSSGIDIFRDVPIRVNRKYNTLKIFSDIKQNIFFLIFNCFSDILMLHNEFWDLLFVIFCSLLTFLR